MATPTKESQNSAGSTIRTHEAADKYMSPDGVAETDCGSDGKAGTVGADDGDARCWSRLCSFKDKIDDMVQLALAHHGRLCARYPWRFIVPALVISALFSLGWLNFRIESSTRDLWIPQNTLIRQQESQWLQHFDGRSAFARFIAEDGSGLHGTLTPDIIDRLFQTHESALSLLTSKTSLSRIDGTLAMWCDRQDFNVTVLQQPNPQLALQNIMSYNRTQCAGNPVSLPSVCAGARRNSDGLVQKCDAIRVFYSLETFNDDMATSFRNLMNAEAAEVPFTLVYSDVQSLNDAVQESTTSETGLFAAAYSLLFAFLSFLQTRKKWIHSRPFLSLIAVGCVALTVISGYGIVLTDHPFTSLQALLPYILAAVGVDDAILIMETTRQARVQLQDVSSSTEELMAYVMQESGLSVITTSVTDLLAFMLGSLSILPAIRWFCYFAAVTLSWLMVLYLTIFVPVTAMFERRVTRKLKEQQQHAKLSDPENGQRAADAIKKEEVDANSLGSRYAEKISRHFIMRFDVRICVICIAIALTILFGVQSTTIERGLPLANLALEGSYVRDFNTVRRRTFGAELGPQVGLCFKKEVSFSSPGVQTQMLNMHKSLEQYDSLIDIKASDPTWLAEAISLAQGSDAFETGPCGALASEPERDCSGDHVNQSTVVIAKQDFASVVRTLLNQTGSAYSNSVDIASDGSIEAACMNTRLLPIGTNSSLKRKRFNSVQDAEQDLRSRWEQATDYSTDSLYLFGVQLIFWEQDAVIGEELQQNLILAGSGVAIMSFITTRSLVVSVLCTMSIAFVDVFLLGVIWLRDYRLNSISVINLIVAVGLAIDFTLHQMVSFLFLKGEQDPKERVIKATKRVGASVLAGGVSSFVALVPLAASKSYIFRVFFYLLVCSFWVSMDTSSYG